MEPSSVKWPSAAAANVSPSGRRRPPPGGGGGDGRLSAAAAGGRGQGGGRMVRAVEVMAFTVAFTFTGRADAKRRW